MKRPRLARLAAAVAAACLSLGLTAVPVNAAPLDITYTALGDSFSSGLGNNNHSYADILDAKKYVDGSHFAFPGATTKDVLMAASYPGAVGPDTDLITLTVGGNDVDWVGVLQACATSPEACLAAVGGASATMQTTLRADLDDLFTTLSMRAPNAKVVVLGYPHLFTPDPADPMSAAYTMVNAATDQLNSIIAAEVAEADALGGADFRYVDVTKRFAGHGANSPDPWINPYPAVSETGVPLHPNAQGQQAYYAAVRSTGKLA